MRSLVRSMVLSGNITTTEARAKEIRPHLEKLITRSRKGTLADQKQVSVVIGRDAAVVLKTKILPQFGERRSGFVRIIRFGTRRGDAAPLARMSFVD